MPLYEVLHASPLSLEQQDKLAEGITTIHADLFTTPKLFVNVVFRDTSATNVYVAGKKKQTNLIMANVRHGSARSQKMYDELCGALIKLWATLVDGRDTNQLRAVFVLGTIVAGSEVGLPLPPAGGDVEWLKKYFPEFEQRAAGGDEDFVGLLAELRNREDLVSF